MSYIPDCRPKYKKDACLYSREEIPENEINEYWYGLLQGYDKEFVSGFDWCVEMALNNLFDNIEVYGDELRDIGLSVDEVDSDIVNGSIDDHNINFNLTDQRKCKWYCEYTDEELEKMSKTTRVLLLFKYIINEHIEKERDMLITSMIDSMDDNEHAKAMEEAGK